MQVLRLEPSRQLRLYDEPVPVPGPGEALVRVTAVGLCGSDLHWLAEGGIGDARLERPLVLGHEAAGTLENGERVAIDPAVPCGECEFCREGNPNLCIRLRFAGHGLQDGALREFIAWPARCLYPLPDRINDAEGAMLEPLGVALHAVHLGHIQPGMTVGVLGCGPIGLLIVQLARLSGAAAIYATERLAHRLDAARACGATSAIPVGPEAETIERLTGGRGVDVVFEAAGEDAAVQTAVQVVKPGGCIVLAGIPGDNRTTFDAATARRKGLTVKWCRRMKHTYPRAIRLVESGMVDVASLVTHRFTLAEGARAFEVLRSREGIKVVVAP